MHHIAGVMQDSPAEREDSVVTPSEIELNAPLPSRTVEEVLSDCIRGRPGVFLAVVVTDSAEVFRLGTSKAEENLAFRRYLSAHHVGDKPFQLIASEIQKHIDCTACANCCRHSVVSVNRKDIEIIASYLAATPDAVTRLFTVPDPDTPTLRVLRSSREGCVFLQGNRCRIYVARPKACQDFPHVAVGTHSLGGRQSSHARWATLCPIIYNALESYKQITGYNSDSDHDSGPVRSSSTKGKETTL
jgi:uncharacterized protein